EGSAEVLFYQRQKILAKIIVFLSKEAVGDIEGNRLAGATKFPGFLYQLDCLRAHFFQRMLKRGERGGDGARVAWKMQNARHLSARFAVCTGSRHREGVFNRIG